jgi:PAS domain S-box-containing protein
MNKLANVLKENTSLEDLPFEISSILNTYSIIAVTDVQGKIIFVNNNFCTISGYAREELVGRDHRLINSRYHGKTFFKELWETVLSGNIWHGEVRNRAKDGSNYWTDTHIIPQKNENDEVAYLIAVRIDISERKKLEKEKEKNQSQLIMADKMASLGILTSGVAHEINNPNHLIMSNCELLKQAWLEIKKILNDYGASTEKYEIMGLPYSEVESEIDSMFLRILGGTERIKNIVDNLKGFSRGDEGKLNFKVHINEIVHSSLMLVKNILNKSTDNFNLNLENNLPSFQGNPHQIEQILLNFITNACQALENTNEGIEIATSYDSQSDSIILEVIDEGMGIQKEIINKVMDPFFTTKRTSGGTGLGLYVSFKIAESHKAKISFTPRQPKGCVAKLTIPTKN